MITKLRTSFASVLQAVLIVLLAFSFILITQRYERTIYRYGVQLLIVTTLLQVPAGNIPPRTGFFRTILYLVIGLAAIYGVVRFSIYITPDLIALGQG